MIGRLILVAMVYVYFSHFGKLRAYLVLKVGAISFGNLESGRVVSSSLELVITS